MPSAPALRPRRRSISNRSLLSILSMLLVLPVLTPIVASRDDGLFLYPYIAVLEAMCTVFCVVLARRRKGVHRLQWGAMGIHFGLSVIVYCLSFVVSLDVLHSGLFWQREVLATASRAAALVAVTASHGEGSRRVRLLDTSMALMLPLLQFMATYSVTGGAVDHNHLYIAFASNLFIALVASVAFLTDGLPSPASFSVVALAYLWYRVFDDLVVNLLNYEWLARPRIVPFNLLFGIAPLLFCWMANRALQTNADVGVISRRPWLRSLLVSMLALTGVALAPFAMRGHAALSAGFVTLLVALYMTRTNLLYRRLLHKQTELRSHAGRLERLVARDALTGIGNRRSLQDAAAELLSRQPPPSATLILVDTDHFKRINDSFGHSVGDDVLKMIAGSLYEEAEKVDDFCCARLGGDEFVALLPGADTATTTTIAEGVRRRVQEQYLHTDVRATVSVGITVSSGEWTLSALLKDADDALYRAKSLGRNKVLLASDASEDRQP